MENNWCFSRLKQGERDTEKHFGPLSIDIKQEPASRKHKDSLLNSLLVYILFNRSQISAVGTWVTCGIGFQ